MSNHRSPFAIAKQPERVTPTVVTIEHNSLTSSLRVTCNKPLTPLAVCEILSSVVTQNLKSWNEQASLLINTAKSANICLACGNPTHSVPTECPNYNTPVVESGSDGAAS